MKPLRFIDLKPLFGQEGILCLFAQKYTLRNGSTAFSYPVHFRTILQDTGYLK